MSIFTAWNKGSTKGHKGREVDEENDDSYAFRSSIDEFIAEDFMRLSNGHSLGKRSLDQTSGT